MHYQGLPTQLLIYFGQHCLARDWLTCIAHGSNLVDSGEGEKRRCALLGLLRQFGREFVEQVDLVFLALQRVEHIFKASYKWCFMYKYRIDFSGCIDVLKMSRTVLGHGLKYSAVSNLTSQLPDPAEVSSSFSGVKLQFQA